MIKKTAKIVAWYSGAAIAFITLLLTLAKLTEAPFNIEHPNEKYSKEEIKEIETARKCEPKEAIVIYQDVDYSVPNAPWRPKNESPLLTELVNEGKLPELKKRIPERPLVLKGVDGVGRYGGTWLRLGSSAGDVYTIANRLSGATFMRFSPNGKPVVPHVAQSVVASKDNRIYTITLREGMKWSDGHPLTTADVEFWVKQISLNTKIHSQPAEILVHRGEVAEFKVHSPTVFSLAFKYPHPGFPYALCGYPSSFMISYPKHYLLQYHPELGDKALIDREMKERNIISAISLFQFKVDSGGLGNPACPRLWPWVPAKVEGQDEKVYVRNPYYFAVDTEGNQLPYIDRIVFQVKSVDMLNLAAASGDVSMQARHLQLKYYSLIMSRRKEYGYQVFHYKEPGKAVLGFNLERLVLPEDPTTQFKADLLRNKRFRQAVSIAINRKQIISADKDGLTVVHGGGPTKDSPLYHEKLATAYTQYDPATAKTILDELLPNKDASGLRKMPNGRPLVFLALPSIWTTPEALQMISDDLADVGLHVVLNTNIPLNSTIQKSRKWELAFGEYDTISPLQSNDVVFAAPQKLKDMTSLKEPNLWDKVHWAKGGKPIPMTTHPLYEGALLAQGVLNASTRNEQERLLKDFYDLAAEETWSVGLFPASFQVAIVKNGFKNVAKQGVYVWNYISPTNLGLETFYMEQGEQMPEATNTPEANDLIRKAILSIGVNGTVAGQKAAKAQADVISNQVNRSIYVLYGVIVVLILGLIMLTFKYPFILRRLVIMVPLLLAISAIVFTVIQAPPGDFITAKIEEMELAGEGANMTEIDSLRKAFWLDDPAYIRYARWMGFTWFLSFDSKDCGLLQGNMGRSMESKESVNAIIGERLAFTFVIALCSIIFTWALAIPIGIFSACKQYTVGDYIFSFLGFIGMSIPGFLLAILLMFVSETLFGISVSGLYSAEFAAQPGMSWPKFIDLLKHLWVPIVIMGMSGTAGMIRVMRANLLDELSKPYVITAEAKGVSTIRLLFKYPVRIALNPFISGIGGILPMLISGGAIVAITLSLPTIGPLLLNAIMAQDVYFASSQLMLLTSLSIVGTLFSDILLIVLDPRIRHGK